MAFIAYALPAMFDMRCDPPNEGVRDFPMSPDELQGVRRDYHAGGRRPGAKSPVTRNVKGSDFVSAP
jgi:hypothetical protein